jgi:hypothetical protein
MPWGKGDCRCRCVDATVASAAHRQAVARGISNHAEGAENIMIVGDAAGEPIEIGGFLVSDAPRYLAGPLLARNKGHRIPLSQR